MLHLHLKHHPQFARLAHQQGLLPFCSIGLWKGLGNVVVRVVVIVVVKNPPQPLSKQ
jgi:hypothetical protein